MRIPSKYDVLTYVQGWVAYNVAVPTSILPGIRYLIKAHCMYVVLVYDPEMARIV